MNAQLNPFAFLALLRLHGVRLQERMAQATLTDKAIGIMIFAVVVGAVAIPVVQDSLVLDTQTVTNETHNSSGSIFDVVTANSVEDGLVEDTDTVFFEDSFSGGSTFVVPEENYTLDLETGEFNFTEADLNGDGTTDVNSTDDQYQLSFNFKPDGFVGGTAGTVLGFVVTMLALSLFIASLIIVL